MANKKGTVVIEHTMETCIAASHQAIQASNAVVINEEKINKVVIQGYEFSVLKKV